jgi:hypothetical protein
LTAGDELREIFADGWTVFEAVAGSATGEPDVFESGMTVENEIAVGSVFVLADAALDKRSVGEGGEALGKVSTHFVQRAGRRDAVGGIGIDGRPMAITG